jgi:hypothetical protein
VLEAMLILFLFYTLFLFLLIPQFKLNRAAMEHLRNNQYFSTEKELIDKMDKFFSLTLSNIGDILVSKMNNNFSVHSGYLRVTGFPNEY